MIRTIIKVDHVKGDWECGRKGKFAILDKAIRVGVIDCCVTVT